MAEDINIVYASRLKDSSPPLHDGNAYCPSQQCHQGLMSEINRILGSFQTVQLWCLPDTWCRYRNHPGVWRTESLSWPECLTGAVSRPLILLGPCITSGHVRIDSAFIEKHKVLCAVLRNTLLPVFPFRLNVGDAPVPKHEGISFYRHIPVLKQLAGRFHH